MPRQNLAVLLVLTLLTTLTAGALQAQADLQVRMPDGSTMQVQLAPNQDLQVQDEASGPVYRVRLEGEPAQGERWVLLLLDGDEQLVQRVELGPGERVTAGRDGQFVELLRSETSDVTRTTRTDVGYDMVRLEVAWNDDGPAAVALAMPGEPVQLSRPGVTLQATVDAGLVRVQLERAGRTARYSLPVGAQLTLPAAGVQEVDELAAIAVRATPHTPNAGQAYALPVSEKHMTLCVKLEDGENITGVVREGELFRIRAHEQGPTLALSAAMNEEADAVEVQVFEILTTDAGQEVLRHVEGVNTNADTSARVEVRGMSAEMRAMGM